MKINFIIPGAGLSGGIKMVFQYANYLSEQGHEVICYYPLSGSYMGWKKVFFFKAMFRQLVFSELKGNWYTDKKFLLKRVFSISNQSVLDGDIVIATAWKTAYWVNGLSKKKGKKVYFVQGFEEWGNKKQRLKARKSYHLKFDMVITVSHALREKLIKETGVDSIVVCNGILKSDLGNRKAIHGNVLETCIGFPYRDNNVGSEKNCDTAIKVLKQLKGMDISIQSYGLKKPNGWPDEWSFIEHPSRKELYDFYTAIDIFYVPSLYEGWGLPAMEAMAHGAVVLAGNSGVIAEMGQDKVNCRILDDPLDIQETVSKLMELIQDEHRRVCMGNRAYEIISKCYTFEKSAEKFEKELESIPDI